jgi:hypothetical protein
MKTLLIIISSIVITLLILIGVYYFVPVWQSDFIGTTLTTLNGTDTMNNFPTVYNANNAAINAGKIEVSTTSLGLLTTAANLTSVGTITSGTWSGTVIAVAKGGTGTTSPTLNMVILGNGTAGFKVVNGFGTSGQSLVSTGSGSAPTWQSVGVNQADNYTWTGLHIFNASTTLNATTSIMADSLTNRALRLNGLSYQWPTAHGISGQSLVTDGTGILSYGGAFKIMASSTVAQYTSTANEKTIVATTSIPANTLGTNSVVKFKVAIDKVNGNGMVQDNVNNIAFRLKYGTATLVMTASNTTGGTVAGIGTLEGFIMANGATNSQIMEMRLSLAGSGWKSDAINVSSTSPAVSIDSTSAQNLVITWQPTTDSAIPEIRISAVYIEAIK